MKKRRSCSMFSRGHFRKPSPGSEKHVIGHAEKSGKQVLRFVVPCEAFCFLSPFGNGFPKATGAASSIGSGSPLGDQGPTRSSLTSCCFKPHGVKGLRARYCHKRSPVDMGLSSKRSTSQLLSSDRFPKCIHILPFAWLPGSLRRGGGERELG